MVAGGRATLEAKAEESPNAANRLTRYLPAVDMTRWAVDMTQWGDHNDKSKGLPLSCQDGATTTAGKHFLRNNRTYKLIIKNPVKAALLGDREESTFVFMSLISSRKIL